MSDHTSTTESAEAEQECGFAYDHDEDVTYEDDELIQWVCRRCGAEGEEDLTTPPWGDPVSSPGHRARDLLAICAGAVILAALVLMAIHLGHSPPA